MGRSLYSDAHDPDKNPKNQKNHHSSKKHSKKASKDSPYPIHFSPGRSSSLSNEERIALRRRQLSPNYNNQQLSVPPSEINYSSYDTSVGLDNWNTRHQYVRSEGEILKNTKSEDPKSKPSRYDLKGVKQTGRDRNLDDPDKKDLTHDPDTTNESDRKRPPKLDIDFSRRRKARSLIGALSLLDKAIQKIHLHEIDNVDQAIKNLLTAIMQVRERLEGDEPPDVLDSLDHFESIIQEALIPWIPILKDHLDIIIRGTKEASFVKDKSGDLPESFVNE